ncbi:MAG: hypothetical protein IJ291_01510 [Lachnospiraceae bacterium]|nr:hypothetical protein [Lachnospiraceae bacterium]
MADLKKIMMDEIRRNPNIQTYTISEAEEYIDTGLPKTEENIAEAALNYLDEKGYRRRADNLEYAKQMILECSEGYDTVIVKKLQIIERDLFEKASLSELRDTVSVCMSAALNAIDEKLEKLSNVRYQYKDVVVDRLFTEDERPKGHLAGDFETFEELLNRMAGEGWILEQVKDEPRLGGMPPRVHVIFKKEI